MPRKMESVEDQTRRWLERLWAQLEPHAITQYGMFVEQGVRRLLRAGGRSGFSTLYLIRLAELGVVRKDEGRLWDNSTLYLVGWDPNVNAYTSGPLAGQSPPTKLPSSAGIG